MNEGYECKRLSHEFQLIRIKRHVEDIEDPEQLRLLVLHLVGLLDGAKAMIKDLIEERDRSEI